jgi:hypothetical protein
VALKSDEGILHAIYDEAYFNREWKGQTTDLESMALQSVFYAVRGSKGYPPKFVPSDRSANLSTQWRYVCDVRNRVKRVDRNNSQPKIYPCERMTPEKEKINKQQTTLFNCD